MLVKYEYTHELRAFATHADVYLFAISDKNARLTTLNL